MESEQIALGVYVDALWFRTVSVLIFSSVPLNLRQYEHHWSFVENEGRDRFLQVTHVINRRECIEVANIISHLVLSKY